MTSKNPKNRIMKEVNLKKPLLKPSIQNDEQNIKVTDPNFLLACLVAKEWDNDKSNVKKSRRHFGPNVSHPDKKEKAGLLSCFFNGT